MAAATPVTPLEASGLTPLWEENFEGGSLQHLQYTWAKGDNSALDSRVVPGAVYLGQDGSGSEFVEQQINNFKSYATEPLPNVIEFDVRNPIAGRGRISLRPRRRGDMVHIQMGLAGDATKVNVRFKEQGTTLAFAEKTGPSRGWTHISISYRQFLSGGVWFAHYVIAVNEEVKEIQGESGIVDPDWQTHWNSGVGADGWSIEHKGSVNPMGKWVANVRGYDHFLTRADLSTRLSGRVTAYRTALSDPLAVPGKGFQLDRPLETHGPNAIAYADVIAGRQVRFDSSQSSSWADITAYRWTFSDGTSSTGRTVTRTFAAAGSYTASVTVTSKYGTDTRQVTVTVN